MFYDYRQNNSGGSFVSDEKRGISVNVIIEATSAVEADDKAQRIGLYFEGVDAGRDCDCCGDRWYPANNGWSFSEATEEPSIYGKVINIKDSLPKDDIGWVSGFQGYIHYLDGSIVGFWPRAAQPNNYRSRPDSFSTQEWHGDKLYGTCQACGKLVRINKLGLGSMHICVSED